MHICINEPVDFRRFKPNTPEQGVWFENNFCNHCTHKQGCSIPILAMTRDIDHPDYPYQWFIDLNNTVFCADFNRKKVKQRPLNPYKRYGQLDIFYDSKEDKI